MLSRLTSASRSVTRQISLQQNRYFCATASAAGPALPEVIATKADFEALQKYADHITEAEKKTKHELLTLMADNENKRRAHEASKAHVKKRALADFDVLVQEYIKKVDQAVEIASQSLKIETPSKESVLSLKNQMSYLDNELLALFKKVGIERIDPIGQKFDANYHEALFRMPDPTKPSDSVAFVMQTGYSIHERVLRAAKVGVVQN